VPYSWLTDEMGEKLKSDVERFVKFLLLQKHLIEARFGV
jgi:hypothetical protein